MFSNDQLSALNQLKTNIRSSRDIAQGSVRATSGRFGFVTLDDGRDAFLNPEQMERVFPGDRVEVEVNQNEKEQYEATLEKLIESPVSFLSGSYCVRGKGHFIATDMHNFNRWVFIPPKHRGNTKEGDFISAKVIQHPFKDGRAQAKITTHFGKSDTPQIERLYSIGKHELEAEFTSDVLKQANQLNETPIEKKDHWQDLRHLPFVTIDSAATRDMDDAIAIQANDNGWTLSVAIAAPSVDITHNTLLDKIARQRAQTTYLPDKPLPMLPETLSVERYSLKSQEDRMSLVFECDIDASGAVSNYQFIPAIIQSHGKLSYGQVAALLDKRDFTAGGTLSDATPFTDMLETLHRCTQQLKAYRKEHHIVLEHRPDFALYLDNEGKLENIEKLTRNSAHTMVEESMLLTNRCAGEFLAQHKVGLFNQHLGYRSERRADIEALLSEKLETSISNTENLDNYINLINTLQSDDKHALLLAIQQRFLEPSQLGTEALPHFGLGFPYYATITSPIRRYQDLYNQRLIYQILSKEATQSFDGNKLTTLHENIRKSRNASQYMERWLICDYMKNKMGQTFTGTVTLLTNQGIGVRLDDTGIEGFVPAIKPNRKSPEKTADKVSFNNQRMELVWNNNEILLEQTIEVTLTKIDHEKKKIEFSANFS